MTGEYAAFGQQMRAGAEQAVADINKAGGVLGQQLALEVGDDACDPKQAVSVANDLASKGVKLVSRLKQAGIDVIYAAVTTPRPA
jgi:branched-chain amino acid transport system substrate-binding protein